MCNKAEELYRVKGAVKKFYLVLNYYLTQEYLEKGKGRLDKKLAYRGLQYFIRYSNTLLNTTYSMDEETFETLLRTLEGTKVIRVEGTVIETIKRIPLSEYPDDLLAVLKILDF